ncbi:hypothetical protein EDD17DRAFT_1655355 [Pisolithus thermaeus]|nr:hypothetical protein EDD17DRAFT_1655355 [Pisolithus thermaeus]
MFSRLTSRTGKVGSRWRLCCANSQGLDALLIRKVDGDYNNVVGIPGTATFKMLDILVEEEDDFLTI